MTKYYSPSTGGFYDSAVHKKRPTDAIKLTAGKYKALVAAQTEGQEIVINGKTVSAAHPVIPESKKTELARRQGYGSIADQLDMIYWDAVNATTTWVDHIAAVKEQHPKGS